MLNIQNQLKDIFEKLINDKANKDYYSIIYEISKSLYSVDVKATEVIFSIKYPLTTLVLLSSLLEIREI